MSGPMHAYANPTRFLGVVRPLAPWLFWGGAILILAGSAAGLFLVPADYLQGDSFRILYVHVPAAWLGMGGWTAIALSGVAQIVWRHPLAGVAARAVAVPGALLTAICLATGSIWGRPTWGTWWQWDGRMTSMLILLFLYLGYIALASASAKAGERGGVSRVAAIYGIVGAINIPIIKGSVIWWNSLHQAPSIGFTGSSIAPVMLWPLALTVTGFSLWFSAIVILQMRAILANNRIEARLRRMARG